MGLVFLILGTGLACAAIMVRERSARIAFAIGAALNLGGLVVMMLTHDPHLMRLMPSDW